MLIKWLLEEVKVCISLKLYVLSIYQWRLVLTSMPKIRMN